MSFFGFLRYTGGSLPGPLANYQTYTGYSLIEEEGTDERDENRNGHLGQRDRYHQYGESNSYMYFYSDTD